MGKELRSAAKFLEAHPEYASALWQITEKSCEKNGKEPDYEEFAPHAIVFVSGQLAN